MVNVILKKRLSMELRQAAKMQGLYRSWKTWKVMEFRNFISRPKKSWNLIFGP